MSLHVSNTCAHHQEVKITLHSLWYYHHTYRWPSRTQVERGLSQPVHETATYKCDDTRGCVMQFWPPDDEHMCSKHVEAWNKLIVKQKFCASSWLIVEIKIWNPSSCQTENILLFSQVLVVTAILSNNICTTFLNGKTNERGFMNLILLHNNHRHVSATHTAIFRMIRTRIHTYNVSKSLHG